MRSGNSTAHQFNSVSKAIEPRLEPCVTATSTALIQAARELRAAVNRLMFAPPVTHVYNPLNYAWAAHQAYLRRYAGTRKHVLFLGMNPGPFGMVQTGVPFGQVSAVRDWLGILQDIGAPDRQHPKRLVTGFACQRSEISGERLWGLFAQRFGSADKFFQEHFVANYCPLAFVEASGCNRTPDKLPSPERASLFAACDRHLREMVNILQPDWLIGVGGFAAQRCAEVFRNEELRIECILHPSPANPGANRDWAGTVTKQMIDMGVWK